MMNNTITNAATDKQLNFAVKLLDEKALPTEIPAFVMTIIEEARASRTITKREASTLIDWLMALPRKDAPAQPEVGVYVLVDGTIVKTQMNKAKTNVYTLRWIVIGGERLVDATEDRVHGEWEYAPELKAKIGTPDARKMTLDEAKDFILRYGQCCRCSRKLKAADSVERGIGPVCVKYFSFG